MRCPPPSPCLKLIAEIRWLKAAFSTTSPIDQRFAEMSGNDDSISSIRLPKLQRTASITSNSAKKTYLRVNWKCWVARRSALSVTTASRRLERANLRLHF